MTSAIPAAIRDLSYSRLESFEKCPRAFWHAYIDKTPPDGFDRIEAWAGTLVHQVLEEALKETFSKRVPDPVGILQRFDELWKAGFHDEIVIVKERRQAREYHDTARASLKGYVDQAWPFLDATPLHIEEPVEFPVDLPDGARVRFAGILDRVDRLNDGRLRLIDYKTGAWVPKFESDRDAFQLALYWRGLLERYPETKGGVLVWHYLQHNETKRIDPSPTLLEAAADWVRTSAQEIRLRLDGEAESKERFPAKPSILCKWCEFGYACAANPYRATAPVPKAGPARARGRPGRPKAAPAA